jgi:hypothetical protein
MGYFSLLKTRVSLGHTPRTRKMGHLRSQDLRPSGINHLIYRALYTATRVTLLACQWVALRHSRRKANLNTHAQDHAMSAFIPFEMAPTHVHFLHRAPSVHSLAKEVTGEEDGAGGNEAEGRWTIDWPGLDKR